MYAEKNEDNKSGFLEENGENNYNHHEENREMSSASDNILFKNDDDLMIKESQSDEEPRVTFLGLNSDSKLSAIINLTASAIGGGCLHFPSILGSIGLPLTIIIFLFVSISIYYTIDLLRSFVVDTKYFSFALMTNEILGKNWLKVYTICSLIFYLSIEINYISLIYNLISNMIDFSGDYEILLNILYFLITIAIEIIICSFISKIRKIHAYSLISSFIFIIILFTIIVQGIINIIEGPKNNIKIKPQINNKIEFFFEIMSFIIEYLYGFSYHSSYPTLLSNLKEVDEKNTKLVHNASFIIVSISYFLMTFFGFFLVTPMNEILFIEKSENEEEKIIQKTFFRIILCLFLITVVPLRFIVVRDNYTSLIKQNKLPFIQDLIIVIISLIFCNIFVYLTSQSIFSFNMITNFIQLTGGIFGVIISFVLPVINYIGANGKRKIKSIIGYGLAIIFCAIGLLSVGFSIYGLNIKNDYVNE